MNGLISLLFLEYAGKLLKAPLLPTNNFDSINGSLVVILPLPTVGLTYFGLTAS